MKKYSVEHTPAGLKLTVNDEHVFKVPFGLALSLADALLHPTVKDLKDKKAKRDEAEVRPERIDDLDGRP